jgi:hypothetical protein
MANVEGGTHTRLSIGALDPESGQRVEYVGHEDGFFYVGDAEIVKEAVSRVESGRAEGAANP